MLRDLLRLSDKGYQELKNAVFACVVANLTLILPFMIVMQVITTLIAPLYRGEALDTQRLWMLFGAGIAAAVLYYVAYRNEYDKTYTVAYREAEHMRVEVAERMRKLPLSFFNQKDLSELTTNIMGDCANIEHTMSHLVPSMIANIITISLTCVLLALFDWRMALAIFATLPISFLIIFASRGLQNRFGERHVQAKLNVSDQVQEYLDGIKVVKAFGLAGEKSRALDRALKRMMSEAILFEGIAGTFVTLAQMLLRVGSGLVVLVGTYLLSDGSLDAAAFLTFILISVKIYAPVTTIMTLLAEFFYMLNATKRMQVLRQEPLMTGSEAAELTNFDIVFDNVSFAYNEEDVIRDFSATMEQNRVTALVGPSGSGKSTISRLIARFWDVRQGQVLIGGRDVREIDPERLMHYVSFVFQDVVLFNDTVLNNIRLGNPDASESEVRRAAKMARCDEFVENLPQGYDSMLGENGCTLSGGERQRISLARALLKNAPIVLLDEATASLDPENEVQIQAAISELVRGRTVIVIAHRLRTILAADKILVLEDGRLVEQGTGHQLLEQDGLFARLYRIQQESLGWSVKAAGD